MTRKVALAVLFVAFAAAGCSPADPSSQAPSVTTSVDPSSAASESPAAQSSPTTRPSTAPSKKADTGPTYPTSAKSYGSTLLTAWGAKNSSRVGQLAANAAVLQLGAAQSQDKEWTYISCDASGDSTSCLYRNSYGDQFTVTMTTAALGQPTAATDVLVNRTSYASSRTAYAGAFVEAWQSGNVQRMARLASTTVANYFKGKKPLENFTATDMGTKVRVEPASAGGGTSIELTFDSGKLGSAHAITAGSADG
jgi:hypothetical protein